MKAFSKVNISFFILSVAVLIDQGSCETASSCFSKGKKSCLTSSGTCTSDTFFCADQCTATSDCYSSFYRCCNSYCQYNSCNNSYESEYQSSLATATLIAIVVPVVFFAICVFCIIFNIVRASRRRAALQNQVTVINQSQQQQLALQMQNAQAQPQFGYGGNPVMDQQMMQQQMLLMQMQQQQQLQQGGVMYVAQPNAAYDMNNQMMMNNQMVMNNNQMMGNQMIYTPQGQSQLNQQTNNGLTTFI